jgi:hypothetical protein
VCWDYFFWVLKRSAKEMKVILGKCKGGGVEIVELFSIYCERLMIYIIFPSRGLLTCKFFLFCFVNLPKENVFLLVNKGS